MVSKSFNFTKKDIDALPVPTSKYFETYSDTKEPGLKLYVTRSGAKTFFIRKFIDGRDERINIGPYPDLTITQAREKAQELKGSIALGKNPAEEKRKLNQDMTIAEFYEYYKENYSKYNKRPVTIKYNDYIFNSNIKKFLGHKKMTIVTKQDIEKIFKYLCNAKMTTNANQVITLLHAMYNKAIEWGYPEKNPAQGIKKIKLKSRERFIMPDELPRLFKILNETQNTQLKNYILLSLFTGQRRSNVLAMRWDQIDLRLGIWFIPMTKNGESMDCPLTNKAIEILSEMYKTRTSEWVFPSETSACGHYTEPKRAWHTLLKQANIEDLRIHDLRRTLGSYQALNGSTLQIIGKSLGHKSIQSTQIYARLTNDPIRQSTNGAIALMDKYIESNGIL